MLCKSIIILVLVFPAAQAHMRQATQPALPEDLSETEVRAISKERNPKSHVSATIKISTRRIDLAYQMMVENNFQAAVQNVDTYTALIRYADDYARQIPDNKIKDRNNCLKKIEQAIFKTSRTLDAVMRGLPFNYRESTENTVEEIKQIRLRAINDLIGGGKAIDTDN
ncbi:MAG: hypothetical protein IPM66_21175 [Acidobacteriota bacterium]|nr:MAG: hypothetical protein IPM66_21175 [Acidobacteriota bacterium]